MEKTEHWRGLQADFGRLRISSEIAKMPLVSGRSSVRFGQPAPRLHVTPSHETSLNPTNTGGRLSRARWRATVVWSMPIRFAISAFDSRLRPGSA